MKPFDSSVFGMHIAPLLGRPTLPALGPGVPNQVARGALAAVTPEGMFTPVADRSMAMACISGLWLLHDFLDESHAISQELVVGNRQFLARHHAPARAGPGKQQILVEASRGASGAGLATG